MKGLVIDSAVSRLTIAAKNDDKICTAIYDIGMKQSETLVPAIDYVLSKAGIEKKELEYCAFCIGPGSFTGLRLGISAVKAIELAFNIPVYGFSSLKTYAYPFVNFDAPILSCIDANKDKYYSAIYQGKDGELSDLLSEDDYPTELLLEKLKSYDSIILAGPDAHKFQDLIHTSGLKIKTLLCEADFNTAQILFNLAEKEKTANNPGIKDYDGPVYLRASEAEIKLTQN